MEYTPNPAEIHRAAQLMLQSGPTSCLMLYLAHGLIGDIVTEHEVKMGDAVLALPVVAKTLEKLEETGRWPSRDDWSLLIQLLQETANRKEMDS